MPTSNRSATSDQTRRHARLSGACQPRHPRTSESARITPILSTPAGAGVGVTKGLPGSVRRSRRRCVLVRIRMQRMGRRHLSYYRINAVEKRVKRDGKVLENLGWYSPQAKDKNKQLHL
ncbi:MAG: 30S ribosomal protein S16, partial [Phycisphaerales bacterium]|nr:30S ribosomal protein S16 [Phycisphaerales bacterium]